MDKTLQPYLKSIGFPAAISARVRQMHFVIFFVMPMCPPVGLGNHVVGRSRGHPTVVFRTAELLVTSLFAGAPDADVYLASDVQCGAPASTRVHSRAVPQVCTWRVTDRVDGERRDEGRVVGGGADRGPGCGAVSCTEHRPCHAGAATVFAAIALRMISFCCYPCLVPRFSLAACSALERSSTPRGARTRTYACLATVDRLCWSWWTADGDHRKRFARCVACCVRFRYRVVCSPECGLFAR